MVAGRAGSVIAAAVLVSLVAAFARGGAPVRARAGFITGTPGAPVVDATPYNYAKQDYTLCAVQCFATVYRQSTVPYISMGTPRSITLVYNSHRAKPRPYVLINVSPDPNYGQTPTEYRLQVKVNGAFVTFVNGEQTLRFTYPGAAPGRLGGELNAVSDATGVYPMDILVSALYSGGTLITTDIATTLVVVNETGSPIAAGWTLAGIQRLYLQTDSSALVTEGDGSSVYFAHTNGVYLAPGGEFSTLILSTLSGSNGWARLYSDSSKAVFDNAGHMVQLRDRFNNITTVTYDGSGRVVKITDPMNLADTLIYGTNGLTSIKDPGGRITGVTVESASSRRLLAITDPDNVSTNFVTDATLLVGMVVDRRGDTTRFGYDTLSPNLCCLTFPPVPIFGAGTVSPTESHYPWQEVGVPYGPTAVTPWPTPRADTVRARITDARGYTTVLQVDRFGAITQEVDPLGRTTTLTRDVNSLVVRDSFPSSGVDSIVYNASGLPTFEQPAGLSAINLHYAAYGQADSTWGTGRATVRNYIGANGHVDSTMIGGQAKTKFTYDAQGRVLSTIDPQGHLLGQHTYSSTNGNVIKDSFPGGRVSIHFYDAFGRDTAVQKPATPLRRTHYDLLNRATQLYDGVNSSPTVIAYDSQFVRSVTDPKSQVYGFSFNALGWMTQRTDPAGRAEQYLYDRVGDLQRWVNRRGDSLAYTYDALRRRTAKGGTNTAPETWSYSTNGRVITTTSAADTETVYFNVARLADSVKTALAGVTGQTYWRRYHYTAAGLVDSVDATGGGITFHARKYVYDPTRFTLGGIHLAGVGSAIVPNGDLQDTSVAFPAGDRVSRQYYPLHSVTQLNTGAAYNLTIARSVGFDSLGRISIQVVGNGATGDRYTYDGLGRLLTDSSVNNPSPPASCSGNPPPTIDAYGSSCVEAGGWSAGSGTRFAYDGAGNRTDNGGTYGTGNRITAFGGCTYGTDTDGNMTFRRCNDPAGGVDSLVVSWTAESRLAEVDMLYRNSYGDIVLVSSVGFQYDALGRLVRENDLWQGATKGYFLWDGFNVLAELNSTGTAEVAEYSYYPGLDHLHALIVAGHEYNAHADALGNVIALTDSMATVQRTYQYDAWGNLTGGSDSKPFNNADHVRWKAALWNPDVDFYYMRNRWYDTHSGRFLSEDPMGVAPVARAPQSRFVCACTNFHADLVKLGNGEAVRYPFYPGVSGSRTPMAAGPALSLHQDGLGSIVALSDNAQTVEGAYGFGGAGQFTGWSDFGPFTTSDRPGAQGARSLEPGLELFAGPQRYESRTGSVLGNPAELTAATNPYVFVGNDPVNNSDPTGLWLTWEACVFLWIMGFALIGFYFGGPIGFFAGAALGLFFGIIICSWFGPPFA